MVGFGRDGDVHSVGKYRPNMTILQVATNRDLQLPWLKEDKTDSAFTIISEPEVRLHEQPDGKVRLEIVGLNAFNPKTGVVEPPSARQVMGIMVDTEYDTQSFRARPDERQGGEEEPEDHPEPPCSSPPGNRRREVGTDAVHHHHPLRAARTPGVKIAVKVIDQTGMEHMTLIDEPRQVLQEQQPTGERQSPRRSRK